MKKILPFLVPTILFSSIAAGQAVKFDLIESPRLSLLLLDSVLIVLCFSFFAYLIVLGKLKTFLAFLWKNIIIRYSIIFLAWALLSLALKFNVYSPKEILFAFSYWARLAMAMFFLGAVYYCYSNFSNINEKIRIARQLIFWGSVAILVGFIQVIFLADFSFMAYSGWDPHQGRLLSTFFDPNYFGTFIVLIMGIVLGLYNASKAKSADRKIYLVVFLVSWLALYLAYSRSAWVQGAIALPLIAFFKNWRQSLLILAVFIIVVLIPNRLSGRITTSLDAATSFASKTAYLSKDSNSQYEDASAAARGVSLRKAWELGRENWLTGVGYNAYGFALIKQELVPNNSLSSHSSQGSDSSLLNIFATTGLVGLVLFLMIFVKLGKFFIKKDDSALHGLKISLFGFMIAWIMGSFFNNSVLYILLLVPFLFLSAIAMSEGNKANIDEPKSN